MPQFFICKECLFISIFYPTENVLNIYVNINFCCYLLIRKQSLSTRFLALLNCTSRMMKNILLSYLKILIWMTLRSHCYAMRYWILAPFTIQCYYTMARHLQLFITPITPLVQKKLKPVEPPLTLTTSNLALHRISSFQ